MNLKTKDADEIVMHLQHFICFLSPSESSKGNKKTAEGHLSRKLTEKKTVSSLFLM